MRETYVLLKKELRGYYTSPIAYVVGALFLAVSGYFFSIILYYSKSAQFGPTVENMSFLLLFLAPLISMRLICEEKKQQTLEILFSRPITEWQIVLSKYLASVVFYLSMLLLTGFFVLVLINFGKPELSVVLSGYLVLVLLSCSMLSVGIFFSTITNNQIIAAISSFCVLMIFWIISYASDLLGFGEQMLNYLSLYSHIADFSKGVIDVKHIVYYLSFSAFWLYMTVIVLKNRRLGAK